MPANGNGKKSWRLTRAAQLLGIDYPIVQAPFGGFPSGIPHEIRDRVFEPFVTAGKANGLGLGLALSRRAVLDHGGDMWAEPAAGARFVMSFPLNKGIRNEVCSKV